MSTFNATSSRVVACVRGLRGTIIPAWEQMQEALVEGWNSEELRDRSEDLRDRAINGLDDLRIAWNDSVADVAGWQHRLPHTVSDLWAGIESDLNTLDELQHNEDTSALVELQNRLIDAVDSTAAITGFVERITLAEVAMRALPDLGFEVIRADGEYSTAIEASKGDEKLLVVLEDGGNVTNDWVGLTGGSCVVRQAQVIAAFRTYGVELHDDARVERHNDPRGGQLVAAAARHRGESLAHGAVLEADRLLRAQGPKTLFNNRRAHTSSSVSEGLHR